MTLSMEFDFGTRLTMGPDLLLYQFIKSTLLTQAAAVLWSFVGPATGRPARSND